MTTLQSVKLGSVVDIHSGFAFESKQFNSGKRGFPLVRIRDVTRGFSETYYEGDFNDKFLIKDGDLLVGMDGEFNRERWTGGLALLNQRVCRLTPLSEKLDADYLYHLLPNILKKIESATSFVTVKHLSARELSSVEIRLPPLGEQRRIAAILDKADALRKQRRRAIALLDSLTQSIFLEMFGEIQPDWPILTIDQVGKKIRTGPFGSQLLHSEFVDSGIAVLGIDNVVQNVFKWAKPRFITNEKFQSLNRYKVYAGDVLITIMGTIGRCAVVPGDIEDAINTKHICCITTDNKLVLPEYLRACFLWHPSVLQQLGQQTKGAIMDGLNMGIIKALAIPVPPIGNQLHFTRTVNAIGAQTLSATAHRDATESLFSSLQHRAFSGQL